MTEPGARADTTVGDRIRALRKGRGWTVDQLAEDAQVSKGFISLVENGKTSPSGAVLLRLARALSASVDYLLTGEPQKVQQPASSQAPSIPAELIALAEERGWTVGYMMRLLGAQQQILARRNGRPRGAFTRKEWLDFEEKLRPYLVDDDGGAE